MRSFAIPGGHWSWPISAKQSQGCRRGEFVWVGGQVDLGADGTVGHPGDWQAQTLSAMKSLTKVLRELDAAPEDLVKLLCFYVSGGEVDESAVLAFIGGALPTAARLAITLVPVPYLAVPGLLIEIEGHAMRRRDGGALSREYAIAGTSMPLPLPFVSAVRCGKMIFVSGQCSLMSADESGNIVAQTRQVMAQIKSILLTFGATLDDAVKLNRWYVGHGTVADFEPAALACAAHFQEPGPAATGVPIPTHAHPHQLIKIELIAMLGEDGRRLLRQHSWPESLWDWHLHLPYKHGLKCEGMIFLGGQVSLDKRGVALNPDDIVAQTRQAMVHIGTILRDLGADFVDVCKLTTVYESPPDLQNLSGVWGICESFLGSHVPPVTTIALPKLAYPSLVIEIDTFAVIDSTGET